MLMLIHAVPADEPVVGNPVPDEWNFGQLMLQDVDFHRHEQPGLGLPSLDEILGAAITRHLGPEPAAWPDYVSHAREHDLKKKAGKSRLQWLQENDPQEAALLQRDLDDPFHYWLRVLKSEFQPLSPMMMRLNYIDIYFEEVFPYLCKWIQSDIDGNVPQPEIPDTKPPEPPPILMSIKPGMPQEEMMRIAQSKEFIEASKAYQQAAMAFQQAVVNPAASQMQNYEAAREQWLSYNNEIHDRFLDHLEAKSFTLAAVFIDAYSTQPVGTTNMDDMSALAGQANDVKNAMLEQFNDAVSREAESFQKAFLANLQSRYGNYAWQEGTASHSLTGQLDMEQSHPETDSLGDIREHLLGRNAFAREGYTAMETIAGPNENRRNSTVQTTVTSSLSLQVGLENPAPTRLLAKEPHYLVTISEDPYEESGIVLNLVLRGVPHDFGHSVKAYFSAGGKGSGIEATDVKRELKRAFKEAFLATAGSLYAALPPWPDPPGSQRVDTIGLVASAVPESVMPDGRTTVEIRFNSLKYPAERGSRPVPFPNVPLVIELQPIGAKTLGQLSVTSATTDSSGQATVQFRVPSAVDLRETGVRSVSIHASSPEYGIEDTAYVNFTGDSATVFVEPNFGGVASDHGIVPADPRYPARIRVRVEDQDIQLQAGARVRFRIESPDPVGKLYDAAGNSATEIEVATGPDGFAEVLYRCAEGADPTTIREEVILITSPAMLESQTATIHVGIDLAIATVRNLYQGKGMVNAGEKIPVEITVRDAANNLAADLRQYLSHWGSGGSAGDSPIDVHLTIEPLGNYPQYLLTQIAAQNHPAPAFSDRMELRKTGSTSGNTLWMRPGSLYDYEGLPRFETRFEGQNHYVITARLVDGSGNPLPDANPANDIGYLSVPTGLPADAFSIFFLENPLGPNTPEARFFRTVLNLMGFGSVLSLSDAAHAVNTGDMEALANVVFSELSGRLAENISKSGSALAEYADLYAQLATAEQVTTTLVETKAPIADLHSAFIKAIVARSPQRDTKLLVITGNGSQQVIQSSTGRPVQTTSGSILHQSADAIFAIQNGPVTVLSVPASFQYSTSNADSVQEFRP